MRVVWLSLLVMILLFLKEVGAVDYTYYDATNGIIDLANPVGTEWHELYPNYCLRPFTLSEWKDNGDGILSPCDTIVMETWDLRYCEHVVQVTYTLELTPLQDPVVDTWWDFTEHGQQVDPLIQPICSYWVEIHPEFGREFHISDWVDNGTDRLDSCDIIIEDSGLSFHVEGVHTDIVTEPSEGCPVESSTWTRIKQLFR